MSGRRDRGAVAGPLKAVVLGAVAGAAAYLYKIKEAAVGAAGPGEAAPAKPKSTSPAPSESAETVALSARRLRILADLGRLLPATYPSEKFREIAPGFEAEKDSSGELVMKDHGVVLPKGFTTCGYLVCAVGRMEGLQKAISSCGLEEMRTLGKKWGAWVEPGDGRMPRPGDPYGIDQEHGAPLIVHVGFSLGARKNPDGTYTWTTGDAGQGTHEHQEAKEVQRIYNPIKNTISGPEGKGARKLAGWIDIDKVPLVAAA